MTLIADSRELAAFCERQAHAEFIAIDTEFMRDTTYWPVLCVVQIAGPDEAVAIDMLADSLDPAPLFALLTNAQVLKVFHSARQDMEIFFHLLGRLPGPIFDSQVAAMVCGFGDSVAYQTLARRLAGARIDKSSRFADWSHRPLTRRQIDYALADVTHLRPIYEKLRKKLEHNGREAWLSEEMAILTDPDTYRLDPARAWRRLKPRSTDLTFLAVLQALAAWREREAQRRDTPRNRVIRDEQLLDIAAHRPDTAEQLARTRGLRQDFARGRVGQAILAAVAEGLAVPEGAGPKPVARPESNVDAGPLVELLKVLLKLKCQEHHVAQKLVANAADLEMIALDDKAPVPALSGWRREVFGEAALALKRGELALSADGNEIALIRLFETPAARNAAAS
ncbi:MAG: ribonuclease D [Kiloniellales bacterium]|jgi:ribonuclease D